MKKKSGSVRWARTWGQSAGLVRCRCVTLHAVWNQFNEGRYRTYFIDHTRATTLVEQRGKRFLIKIIPALLILVRIIHSYFDQEWLSMIAMIFNGIYSIKWALCIVYQMMNISHKLRKQSTMIVEESFEGNVRIHDCMYEWYMEDSFNYYQYIYIYLSICLSFYVCEWQMCW